MGNLYHCKQHYIHYRYEYRWADGITIKKPIEVSAPKYVEYLMDWIESQLDDETIFPQRLGMLDILTKLVVQLAEFSGLYSPYYMLHNTLLLISAGAPFPSNFREVVKTIFKRLFRVYAHIYHSHFQKIVSLKEEAHLNTCFKHFVLFTWVSKLERNSLLHLQFTEFTVSYHMTLVAV